MRSDHRNTYRDKYSLDKGSRLAYPLVIAINIIAKPNGDTAMTQFRNLFASTAALLVAGAVAAQAAPAQAAQAAPVKNVVLVHGAFVDGSGWQGVHDILVKDGYKVTIVQNPTITLADDVAVTQRAIAAQDGPVVLVGHSYGGVIITEAGRDPKVKSLVYVAAFAPDAGESVGSLIANPVPGQPVPPILPPTDGFLFVDPVKFHAAFAADLPAATGAFMADSQQGWGLGGISGQVTAPAWKVKPSFYLVAAEDRMIPPPAQRQMSKRAGATVVEAHGSHAIYVSKPQVVADLIEQAAQSVK